MREARISRPAWRYARAFTAWIRDRDIREAVREDWTRIRSWLRDSPELRLFLGQSLLPRAARETILRSIFEGWVHPALFHFLLFLEHQKRMGLLDEIAAGCLADDERERGILRGGVTYAREVEPAVEQRVKIWIERQTDGRTVLLERRTDPALIGGMVVRVGDRLWDGSVAGQMRRWGRRWTAPVGAGGAT